MLPSSLLPMFMKISTLIILCSQLILAVQAGTCFYHRAMDVCYDVSESDTTEESCTGPYYSDDGPSELDGYIFSENCRDVNVTPERCDAECDLGQECQRHNGEEMCVCSEASCDSADHQPVCASNNMTFKSECLMHAWACSEYQSALYKKYDGECQKDCLNVRCPDDTICLLVKNTGEPMCYPKVHCDPTRNPEPVCGTNGVSYPNICSMRLTRDRRGRSPDLAHKGPCEHECRPDLCGPAERCVYSNRLRPVCIRCEYDSRFFSHSGECSMDVAVCGDNGNVYKNYCSLLLDQCKKHTYIDIIGYGSCPVRRDRGIRRKQFRTLKRLNKLAMN